MKALCWASVLMGTEGGDSLSHISVEERKGKEDAPTRDFSCFPILDMPRVKQKEVLFPWFLTVGLSLGGLQDYDGLKEAAGGGSI